MKVREEFPADAPVDVPALVAALVTEPPGGPLTVGDERVSEFLTAFGRRLLAPGTVRRHPELGSLAFFLRRGGLARSLADLSTPSGALRFPRGLVFHLPPANVDTVFVYAWALAALAGNHNVVRISPRSGGVAAAVLDALRETLADGHPAVAHSQRMVTYDRDDAVTAVLSAACDLRVIWGGDESVRRLRAIALPPGARDLVFPDRSSFCVLSAAGWLAAPATERRSLAERLCTDVYWFDQAACSSPRTLFWVGTPEVARRAGAELSAELLAVVGARAPQVPTSMVLHKYVTAFGLAAEGVADRIRFAGNAVTHLDLSAADGPLRDWLGAGTFAWARLDRLADLAGMVRRRDQTVTHFGFGAAELTELARACGGRGVDRIVPVGRALDFAPVWDGYELLREFTRLTTVTT
ncbi:acyl-CoA reductase [Plantactinospora sp. KLBMP9567]|uniref:acyl-CoA reductase n=1 Tax=Plantactinospora sp. KLBMP9567 TaxID=3085900 RepID=UPI0029823EA7|nr:acyl-CoA reductase [Plantactinospora sp. KLBMP9567]MDW5324836.1 acyl-CoA reductase [Plantactinospora sp. KLBMP9567]